VISRQSALLLAGLMILPGSCIAASAKSEASREPTTRTAGTSMPLSLGIGKFQLDRVPQQGNLVHGVVPPGTKRLVIDGRDARFAQDRRFIAGFGRDHVNTTLIKAFLADGSTVVEVLAVNPTSWVIENLSTLPHRSLPDPEFLARRSAELEQINAARRMSSNTEGWRQHFIWPVIGRISGRFGAQRVYAGQPGAPHSGVDIAGRTGTPVRAPADGVVILAASRPFTLEGNLLMIDHGMGLNSAFLHLSRIDVKPGDTIRQGQQIGTVGMTGRATGPHLHWGMKWLDERIDPATLLQQKR
jgi:murein DD-endopeptidase MepM/ murein hydrolase activator NlpD